MKEGAVQVANVILTQALLTALGFSCYRGKSAKDWPKAVLLCCFPSVWKGDLGIAGSGKSDAVWFFYGHELVTSPREAQWGRLVGWLVHPVEETRCGLEFVLPLFVDKTTQSECNI